MNQLTTVQESTAMTIAESAIDPKRLGQCMQLAQVMSQMSLLPDHLRQDRAKKELPAEQVQANCFRIVNQALRWDVDPFALIDETYVVAGKLGYQGKLVAAIVNTRAGLVDGGLHYEFVGEGDKLTVTVSGTFPGGRTETIELSVGDAKTSNEMWKKDPRQKLVYSGATKWARRHCPQVIMGIMTVDDLERITVEPVEPPTVRLTTTADKHTEPKQTAKKTLDLDVFCEHVAACKTLDAIEKAEKRLGQYELNLEQDAYVTQVIEQAKERLSK